MNPCPRKVAIDVAANLTASDAIEPVFIVQPRKPPGAPDEEGRSDKSCYKFASGNPPSR